MKTGLVVAAVLTAAVLGAGGLIASAVEAQTDRCIAAAHELAALVSMRDWEKADEACRVYEAQWKTSLQWLSLVLPEDQADRITEAFAAFGTFLDAGDEAMCLQSAQEIVQAAEQLLEGEKLTLQSLL